jgi:hypothetical protein
MAIRFWIIILLWDSSYYFESTFIADVFCHMVTIFGNSLAEFLMNLI